MPASSQSREQQTAHQHVAKNDQNQARQTCKFAWVGFFALSHPTPCPRPSKRQTAQAHGKGGFEPTRPHAKSGCGGTPRDGHLGTISQAPYMGMPLSVQCKLALQNSVCQNCKVSMKRKKLHIYSIQGDGETPPTALPRKGTLMVLRELKLPFVRN